MIFRGDPAVKLLFLALLALPMPRAGAQQLLYAENGDKFSLVRAAREFTPCVEKDGKIVPLNTRHFVLQETSEFLPEFVSVSNVDVSTSYAQLNGSSPINNTFLFNAEFETGYLLKDVFVVLDITSDRTGKSLFIDEIGELTPNESRHIALRIPINGPMGDGRYTLHIFSGGLEVLQSLIPFDYREAALDRMVAKRIAGRPDGGPKFFVGPVPLYPPALKKAKVSGEAVLSLRIGRNGSVYDPAVVSTTDKAFGDSALYAVRQWRFLPAVRGGQPVELKVNLPIEFTPPVPAKGSS